MDSSNDQRRGHGWLATLLLIPVLIAAAVVGFFVFAVILGLILFAAAVLLLRLWWLRQKMSKVEGSQTLEGEYVVIRESTPRDGNPRR